MPVPPDDGEGPASAHARIPGVQQLGWPSEPNLEEAEYGIASARMLGTAMLIAIASYTVINVGLWRHRRSRRRW